MNTLSTLRSPSELAANKPHGTRTKYLGGCRCLPCRAAHSRDTTEHRRLRTLGLGNSIVDAGEARLHIIDLSTKGVGYRTVAEIAEMSKNKVYQIRTGARPRIRKSTADKILGVTAESAILDGTLVDAAPTWKRIRWLLGEGFTKKSLAERLGYRSAHIQIGKTQCLASTAAKVERFYNMIRAGE